MNNKCLEVKLENFDLKGFINETILYLAEEMAEEYLLNYITHKESNKYYCEDLENNTKIDIEKVGEFIAKENAAIYVPFAYDIENSEYPGICCADGELVQVKDTTMGDVVLEAATSMGFVIENIGGTLHIYIGNFGADEPWESVNIVNNFGKLGELAIEFIEKFIV